MSQNEKINSEELAVQEKIISVLSKFKADILWDEIIGIFDKIPASVKQSIIDEYENSVNSASKKLNIRDLELKEELESRAFEILNNKIYSQSDVIKRHQEYGISGDI